MIQWYRIFPPSGTFSWSWSVSCSSCSGPLRVQSEKGSQGWIFLTGVILLLIFSCLLLLQVGWSHLFTILVKSTAAISVWLCLLPPSQGRQSCLFSCSIPSLACSPREANSSITLLHLLNALSATAGTTALWLHPKIRAVPKSLEFVVCGK